MSKPWKERVAFALADGAPAWERGVHPQAAVPYCSEQCPHHDGKRCRLTGGRPQAICEPAVEAMSVLLESKP